MATIRRVVLLVLTSAAVVSADYRLDVFLTNDCSGSAFPWGSWEEGMGKDCVEGMSGFNASDVRVRLGCSGETNGRHSTWVGFFAPDAIGEECELIDSTFSLVLHIHDDEFSKAFVNGECVPASLSSAGGFIKSMRLNKALVGDDAPVCDSYGGAIAGTAIAFLIIGTSLGLAGKYFADRFQLHAKVTTSKATDPEVGGSKPASSSS